MKKYPDLSGGWNYRVFKYKSGEYGIHEAYYGKKGKVEGWTADPIIVGDSVEDLFKELRVIGESIEQFPEILDYEKDSKTSA